MTQAIPPDPNALLTREQAATALAAAGFPVSVENTGDKSHARRRPGIPKIRIASALPMERNSSLGAISPERSS